MKRILAFKHKIIEPVVWIRSDDLSSLKTSVQRQRLTEVIYYSIEFVADVDTVNGPMKLVKIKHKVELADPSNDIIAQIGVVRLTHKSNITTQFGQLERKPNIVPQPPVLWFWNGQFWLQAIDKLGVPFYRRKCEMLYHVEVDKSDELLASLHSDFE